MPIFSREEFGRWDSTAETTIMGREFEWCWLRGRHGRSWWWILRSHHSTWKEGFILIGFPVSTCERTVMVGTHDAYKIRAVPQNWSSLSHPVVTHAENRLSAHPVEPEIRYLALDTYGTSQYSSKSNVHLATSICFWQWWSSLPSCLRSFACK